MRGYIRSPYPPSPIPPLLFLLPYPPSPSPGDRFLSLNYSACSCKLDLYCLRNDGFLKSIQNVKFPGLSRDQVSFDADGNGLGAYDITVVNTETVQWETIGNWISNTSKVVDLPVNESFLELNLTKLRTLWRKVFNSTVEPTSFCGQLCPPGHWMILDERYQVGYSVPFKPF